MNDDIAVAPAREGAEPVEEGTNLPLTDGRAFVALYRSTYSSVVGMIYRRTGDEDVSRDLASETYLIAWRSAGRYVDRGVPPLYWLMGIATRRVNRWVRDNRRRLARERLTAQDEVSRCQRRSEADEAQAALLALPERFQEVLSLRYLQYMSVAQVSAVLRISEGTVKSRLARGREALAREISRRGGEGRGTP